MGATGPGRALRRDGVVAAVGGAGGPSVPTATASSSPTSSARDRWWCWSNPAGRKDRATELIEEEEALSTSRGHLGRRDRRRCPPAPPGIRPAAHREPGRTAVGRAAGRWTRRAVHRQPGVGAGARRRGPAGRPGTAARRRRLRAGAVLGQRRRGRSGWRPRWPERCGAVDTPASRSGAHRGGTLDGFVLPGIRLAVLAESDVTGRRRPHRPARARARPVDGFFDDLAPGNYVVHRQHGVARYGGHGHPHHGRAPPATTSCSSTGGATGSTSRPTRSTPSPRTPGATRPPSTGSGGRSGSGPGQGPGRRARDRRGARGPLSAPAQVDRATPSRPTRRGSPSWRSRSPTPRPPTSSRPSRR